MKYRTYLSGFTLVELMVTLAIAAVLLTVALPSFRSLIDDNNVDNVMARMADVFAYARGEAVARSEEVTVCASLDGANCAASDNDWNSIWLVRTAGGELLKTQDVRGFQVTFNAFDNAGVDINGLSSVCFDEMGEECNQVFDFVTFTATANGQASSRILSASGTVSRP